VAEGVQDAETYQRLLDLGCNLVQGYYVSKPKPAAELLPRLLDPAERWPARRLPGATVLLAAS
jgi:EAL domain-containing protein (putative c-di-GMP-specific phosphodiesterase class I)